jgi:two-component system phosphate regulon sensor histidine kinase PhoR
MDPWVWIAIALAIATVVLTITTSRRGRDLRRATATIARIRAEDADREQASVDRVMAETVLHETLESGVVRLDAARRVRDANARAHALLGRAPGALLGRSVMETFLDPTVERLLDDARADRRTVREIRPEGPDGPVLLVHARPLPDGGAWLVLEDVSELRRLQRIRAEFIDNLSHELRTPLTPVRLLAETLQREADAAGDSVPARMRERIAKIEVETGHLVQMVNELLDLSRIEHGGTLQLIDGVDLGRLAAEAAERLRLFAERQGITLRVEPATGIPSVRGDPARLGQVVVNLVHNAVKFSPDGGEIVVRVRRDGDVVVTSVEDHGIGIPRAARTRVFERFYKVDRARLRAEAGGGTGLGLAIARHVVEQHGGRIWVDSTDGAGSTFSFALPIAGVASELAAGDGSGDQPASSLAPPRI